MKNQPNFHATHIPSFWLSHPLVCNTRTIIVEYSSDTLALIKCHDFDTFTYYISRWMLKYASTLSPTKKNNLLFGKLFSLSLVFVSTFHIENLHFTLRFEWWKKKKKMEKRLNVLATERQWRTKRRHIQRLRTQHGEWNSAVFNVVGCLF